MTPIPVIDVFAGPGGLNEGFSAFDGGRKFSTVASIEMDPVACQTLRLRAAARRAQRFEGRIPREYFDFMAGELPFAELASSASFAPHWKEGVEEVHQHELSEASRAESDAIIGNALDQVVRNDAPWVLIGGPPCQAYSLVGRSRRKHDEHFQDDHKHTLYREYLHIIRRFRPHVFVMENVKGMLSSKHDGGQIFKRICEDLGAPARGLNYELRSFVTPVSGGDLQPSDYIIKAERFGVPQTRHRVIILGVRTDVTVGGNRPTLIPVRHPVSVSEVIGDMPPIRSGVSPRRADSWDRWLAAYTLGASEATGRSDPPIPKQHRLGIDFDRRYVPRISGALGAWLRMDGPLGVAQHVSRYHMESDLSRYAFLAHAARLGERPRLKDLPSRLIPNHANATRADAPFTDRFRVQIRNEPSSTITSHIAKDGHYYIHYDPSQMRSLTVREAARLQTFPDNYHFMGNRTQQYHQVGNAVPPFLATQLAEIVAGVIGSSTT